MIFYPHPLQNQYRKGNHSTWAHRMGFVINRSRYIKILNLDLVRRIIVRRDAGYRWNLIQPGTPALLDDAGRGISLVLQGTLA